MLHRCKEGMAALAVALVACSSSSRPVGEPGAPPLPSRRELPVLADVDGLARWADRELAGLPSAVIGVVDRDGVRWSHGAGARDARGGAPPDARSVYRIGSITKVLTGVAVLQQRDRGTLTLDEPVGTRVPELASRLAGVTIRNLVTHTSGIPSVGDASAPYWQQTPPSEAAMLRALDTPLDFAPGTVEAYSNAGMALAGLVAARAAGAPWRTLLQQDVLTPLGMTTAVWDRGAVPVDRLAIGVGEDGTIDPPHWQLGTFEPAGGLYASLDDLAGVARLALGAFPSVLAPASLAESLADGPLPGAVGVAWQVGTVEGAPLVGHTGSTGDYSSSLIVVPGSNLAVVVLGAGPDADRLDCVAKALVRAAVRKAPLGSCIAEPLAAEAVAAATIAVERLLALAVAHDEAAIRAAFTPDFLIAIPPAQIGSVLDAVASQLGACDRFELLGARDGVTRATLHCASGPAGIGFAVEDAAPHRFTALRFE